MNFARRRQGAKKGGSSFCDVGRFAQRERFAIDAITLGDWLPPAAADARSLAYCLRRAR
jgi:hypothetical protein